MMLALAGMLFACGGEENKNGDKDSTDSKDSNKITKFSGAEYSFTDSSVEPQYHRSWSVNVNGSKVTFQITAYNTVLIEKEYSLTQDQANLMNEVIPALQGLDKLEHGGESGSTSEGLKVFSGSDVVAEAYWNGKGNKSVAEFGLTMKSMVPDFDELMESTMINGPIVFLSDSIPEDVDLEEFNKLAMEHGFKIVPNSESDPKERKATNELRKKLMSLLKGEDWQKTYEESTGNFLDNFNI